MNQKIENRSNGHIVYTGPSADYDVMRKDLKSDNYNSLVKIGFFFIAIHILSFINSAGGNIGLVAAYPILFGWVGVVFSSLGLIMKIVSRIRSKIFGSAKDYFFICFLIFILISPLHYKVYEYYRIRNFEEKYQKFIKEDVEEEVLSSKFAREKEEYEKTFNNLRQYTDDTCGISFKYPAELSIRKVSNAEMSLIASNDRSYYELYFLIGSFPGDEVGSIIFEIVEATSSITRDLDYKGMTIFSLPSKNQEKLYYVDNYREPYDIAAIGKCAIRIRATVAEIGNKNVSDIIKKIFYTIDVGERKRE